MISQSMMEQGASSTQTTCASQPSSLLSQVGSIIEEPLGELTEYYSSQSDSAPDLATWSVQVEGSILTAGKRLSLKNLNVIIRAIN